MICWYCHWGWPRQIADIYNKALQDLDGDDSPLHFGPAHIVWEDENFEMAQSCLDEFEKYRGDYTDEQLEIVKRSLRELLKLPVNITDCWPDEYDGEHPENYPPPKGLKMVKV